MFQVHILFVSFFLIAKGVSLTNGNSTSATINQQNINGTTSDMKGNSLFMSITETTAKPVNYQNTNSTASKANGNFDFMSTISKLLPSAGGDVTKQAAQALQYLKFVFIGDDPQHVPGGACLNDVTEMLQGVLSGEQWAIKCKFKS